MTDARGASAVQQSAVQARRFLQRQEVAERRGSDAGVTD